MLKKPMSGVEFVFLRGNHEQTMLDFLLMDSVGRSWFNYGGLATLASYGVRVNGIPGDTAEYIRIQQELKARIPDRHLKFIEKTQYSFELGAYFFVHAGVYPRLPLSKQLPEDMLWIRDEFLRSRRALEKIIVHGHTVVAQVEMLPYRIGIDTGAYSTGILTCLVLQDGQQKLLQTGI
jgi:serine/threonine protein phosphatase 1